eukprot:6873367-Prymnesium_polylepis.1
MPIGAALADHCSSHSVTVADHSSSQSSSHCSGGDGSDDAAAQCDRVRCSVAAAHSTSTARRWVADAVRQWSASSATAT